MKIHQVSPQLSDFPDSTKLGIPYWHTLELFTICFYFKKIFLGFPETQVIKVKIFKTQNVQSEYFLVS